MASASIHGNTKEVALKVVDLLKEKGVKVAFTDLTRDDMAEAVEDAFRYSKMILAELLMMVVSLVQWKISYIDYNIKDIKIKLLDLLKNGSWAPLCK